MYIYTGRSRSGRLSSPRNRQVPSLVPPPLLQESGVVGGWYMLQNNRNITYQSAGNNVVPNQYHGQQQAVVTNVHSGHSFAVSEYRYNPLRSFNNQR